MTSPEMLESSRAEPDFAAMDDLAEFAVEHAAELAALDRRTAEKPEPTLSVLKRLERAA